MARALVTGGGGFLGGAIVRQLLARGDFVRSFARGDYPELARAGVEVIRGDLSEPSAIARACEGCDVVYHVAAKAGVWGKHDDYHRANVAGTENVVNACRTARVPKLVYTSTPSVVFQGRDMEGADESAPYAEHFHTHYPKTKAVAERMVLDANDDKLSTVALRPHLIWGPGDPHLIPRVIARAKMLRIIGNGQNKVDTIYVDNAAEAHILAADRLAQGSPVAGRAYFITQGEPMVLWGVINRILATAGLPPVTRRVPAWAAYAAGATLEAVHTMFGISAEPRMTRFVARELATAHWFDITAARRDLGYSPRVGFDEGMKRVEAWIKEKGIPKVHD